MNLSPLPVLSLLCAGVPAQFFTALTGTQPGDGVEQLAYDSRRDRVVGLARAGTWEHDGTAWRSISTAQRPRERYEHALCFDGQRVLVHGGGTPIGQSPPALSDLWAYDGSAWTSLSTQNGPGARRGHAMAWDTARGRLVLFGGTDMQNNFFADTWEWDGTAWTQVQLGGPPARVWHRMVYDPGRARVLLVGGAMNPFVFNDTWEWDGTTWTQTANGGFAPRTMPALVYDGLLGRTLVIGGFDGANSASMYDVHAYDPTTLSWSQVNVARPVQLEQVIGGAYDTRRARTVLVTWDAFAPMRSFAFRSVGTGSGSYTSYGQGCAGGRGQVPVLAAQAGTTPSRGSAFTLEVGNVGNASLVLLGTGLSNGNWQGAPLPMSLAFVGLPGCSAFAPFDNPVLLPVDTLTQRASLTWNVPNQRTLAGFAFYQQGLTLDPSASNGVGGLSNACAGVVQ